MMWRRAGQESVTSRSVPRGDGNPAAPAAASQRDSPHHAQTRTPRPRHLGRHSIFGARQLAPLGREERALDVIAPGDGAQDADGALGVEDLGRDLAEQIQASGRDGYVPTPTRMPDGTEYEIRALPPTTDPRPITVLPPRMVALA